MGAIEEVTSCSKIWNQEIFGNIFCMKKNFEARIKGILNSPYYNSSRGLQVLENKLMKDLDETSKQEEIL